jgi:hypothetical protein
VIWRRLAACQGPGKVVTEFGLKGVTEHYFGSGLLRDEMDRLWLERHPEACVMLEHLPENDEMPAGRA